MTKIKFIFPDGKEEVHEITPYYWFNKDGVIIKENGENVLYEDTESTAYKRFVYVARESNLTFVTEPPKEKDKNYMYYVEVLSENFDVIKIYVWNPSEVLASVSSDEWKELR